VRNGEDAILRCEVSGLPEPIIKWYKNDSLLEDFLPTKKLTFTRSNRVLTVKNAGKKDSGRYSCEALNKLGIARSTVLLKIDDEIPNSYSDLTVMLLSVTSGVTLLICLLLVICCIKIRFKHRKNECEDKTYSPDESSTLLPYYTHTISTEVPSMKSRNQFTNHDTMLKYRNDLLIVQREPI